MPTLMKAFQMSSSDFADIFNGIKPDLLVYDGFQPWAAKLAASQSIPAIIFSTSGATTTSFFHHLHTYKSFDAYPYPDIYLRDYVKRELFAQGESIKNEDEGEGFAFGTFQLSHEIILIRSCMAIEGKYFDYFSKLCGKEILPVGPLIARNNDENNKNSEILHWLNKKDPSLTLYISFGSENYLSKNQIQEIAKGLELSNISFIWVVRFPTGSEITIENMLPEGFLDRVKERGIVENGWAPQADILAHETVGGFMSHCGWGSVMESIYFGVPVLAVPLKLDQPVNARLMVETGVGVEVERDENGVFTGEDVAKAISEMIAEKIGEGFRCKAKELSEKMKMEEAQVFDKVAERLRSLCITSVRFALGFRLVSGF